MWTPERAAEGRTQAMQRGVIFGRPQCYQRRSLQRPDGSMQPGRASGLWQ